MTTYRCRFGTKTDPDDVLHIPGEIVTDDIKETLAALSRFTNLDEAECVPVESPLERLLAAEAKE